MGPSIAVKMPMELVRRLPNDRWKSAFRARAFSSFGAPRLSKHFQVPRRYLLVSPGETAVLVGTPNPQRVHLFSTLVGKGGRALILEPEQSNYERLSYAATDHPTVTVDRRGAWNEPGVQEIDVDPDHGGNNRISRDGMPDSHFEGMEVQEIEVERLDDILDEYDMRPDYLEVMVNGAELEVLEGASETLNRPAAPRLLVKNYGYRTEIGDRFEELRSFIESAGYRTVTAPAATEARHPGAPDGDVYAWKPSP